MKINAGTINLALGLERLTTGKMAGFTGSAGDCCSHGAGDRNEDQLPASRGRRALSDNPTCKFTGVNVDVFQGTMQLSGFVENRDQKSRATAIVRQVHGLKEVINNVTVKD